jgi:hypothetical protein
MQFQSIFFSDLHITLLSAREYLWVPQKPLCGQGKTEEVG